MQYLYYRIPYWVISSDYHLEVLIFTSMDYQIRHM
jgi:hypothetical protein